MEITKQKLKCLILEDEQLAQLILKTYVSEIKELDLIACFSEASEAKELLKKKDIDLLFLDINLPGTTSLEMLKTVDYEPMIIFTTAFSQYALESFEHNVVDYLVKPITRELFNRAVKKALDRFFLKTQKEETIKEIEVKVDNRIISLKVEDIKYLQSYGNYVKVFLKEDMILVSSTTQDLQNMLPENDFVRIHKSYIVNKKFIQSIDINNIIIGDDVLPIGISYRQFVATLCK